MHVGVGGPATNFSSTASAGEHSTITTSAGISTAPGADGGTTIGCNSLGYGDGAKALATNNGGVCASGPGYALSDLATAFSPFDTTLFPASADGPEIYGNGGIPSQLDPVSLTADPVAGTGGAANVGLGTSQPGVAQPGSNGLVIFRFTMAPTLAATGVGIPWAVPAISGGLITLGAVLFALRGRRVTD